MPQSVHETSCLLIQMHEGDHVVKTPRLMLEGACGMVQMHRMLLHWGSCMRLLAWKVLEGLNAGREACRTLGVGQSKECEFLLRWALPLQLMPRACLALGWKKRHYE